MDDYISRQTARKTFPRYLSRKSNREQASFDWHSVKVILGSIPASDVRTVVLCRDCRFYSNGFCYNPNTFDDEKTRGNTSPEWFCADGKRREDGIKDG